MSMNPMPLLPRKAIGEQRNLDCPNYRDCLSQAVVKNWADWDCSHCKNRKIRSPAEECDFRGYWLLLRAVFEPEAYKGTKRGRRSYKAL